jgi:uncharacterized phage protein gp47/JayE
MSYILQNKDEIDARLVELFKVAGFSNTSSPGTPEHALYKVLVEELYNAYGVLDSAYRGALPLDAAGANLDLWSTFFGSTRQLATYAKDSTLTNVYFYFPEDFDLSVITEDIDIVTGTLISANGVNKFYTVTEDAELTAVSTGARIIYVKVQAQESGENNNINSDELNTHNLDVSGLLVSNKFPITSGLFPQTDSDLRVSMQNIFGKLLSTNVASMQFHVLNLPGVSNVNIFPLIRGTGTFSLFVDSVAPVVSLELLNQVQEIVDQNKALGTIGYVDYPEYKSITIEFEVLAKEGIDSDALISELESAESQLIVDFINNIPRGESFRPNEMARIVLDNTKVLNATVKTLKIGNYSVIDQTIKDNEIVAPTPKHIDITQKWFCSTDLCSYCAVSFN